MIKRIYLSQMFLLISGLIVLGQSVKSQIGAHQMPYKRYEADAGVYSGGAILKNVSFDQALTQSEASEKKYIELAAQNSFIKWQVLNASGGMTLRFTMPDSNDGTGLTGSLDVFVNESKVGSIDLTSFYAWQYFDKSEGSDRHPVNTPSTGNPRMRFDEERFKFPVELQVGDELKLVKINDDGIAYGVDFVELEAVPGKIVKPNGFISVTDSEFGAIPDDNGDDMEAFEAAITKAKETNAGLYIPEGKFLLSKNITIDSDGFTLQGAGIWYTHLHWTGYSGTDADGGIYGVGSEAHVSDFYMTSNLNNRDGGYRAFSMYWGKNSLIENIWLSHFSVGFWTSDNYTESSLNVADQLTIRNCRIRNTYADGCNFSRGARNCVLEHCSLRNNGDDAMATVSHSPEVVGPCTNNTFRYNTVEFVNRAAGLGIFGGEQHEAHHCIIKDNFAGAGIRVNSTFPASPYVSSSTINIYNMQVERCGTRYALWDNNIGSINLKTRYYDVQNINLKDIDIIDAQTDAIQIERATDETEMRSVYLENITIKGTGKDNLGEGYGIRVTDNCKGWVGIDNITFESTRSGNIYENAPNFEIKTSTTAGSSVNLSPTELSIYEGEVTQLYAKAFPAGTEEQIFSWSSGDTNIASVDQNGQLTALNPGMVTITVEHDNGLTATSEVTVLIKIVPTEAYKIKNRMNDSYLYQDNDMVKYGAFQNNESYYWYIHEVSDGVYELKNKGSDLYMHVQNKKDYVELSQSWPAWSSRRWTIEEVEEQWFCLKNVWLNKRANIVAQTGYLQYANNPDNTETGAQFTLEKENINTGLNKAINLSYKLYPNPVDNELQIQSTTGKLSHVNLLNMQGKTVMKIEKCEGKEVVYLNLESLTPGIYIVQLQDKDGAALSDKIVKR